jgi:hypothetical protein
MQARHLAKTTYGKMHVQLVDIWHESLYTLKVIVALDVIIGYVIQCKVRQ